MLDGDDGSSHHLLVNATSQIGEKGKVLTCSKATPYKKGLNRPSAPSLVRPIKVRPCANECMHGSLSDKRVIENEKANHLVRQKQTNEHRTWTGHAKEGENGQFSPH